MAKILIKRGQEENVNSLTLDKGELAVAFSSDNAKAKMYVGGEDGKILLNPEASIPTKVSQLTNDSKYQTETDVQTAIAQAGHASFKKVDSVPTASGAQENVLYLVMNSKTNHYDIYAKVSNEVVLLDDTTVDLSGYVEKDGSKVLSDNNYTTDEKNKLAGIAANANNYTHPSSHAASMITEDSTHRFMTDAERTKLEGIAENANNYTHPASHAASMITQDATHRFVSDTEKSTWNAKLSASSTIDGGTF